jgi:hypothetical protein
MALANGFVASEINETSTRDPRERQAVYFGPSHFLR